MEIISQLLTVYLYIYTGELFCPQSEYDYKLNKALPPHTHTHTHTDSMSNVLTKLPHRINAISPSNLSRSIRDGRGCNGVNEGLIYAFPIARTHAEKEEGDSPIDPSL